MNKQSEVQVSAAVAKVKVFSSQPHLSGTLYCSYQRLCVSVCVCV